MKQEIKTKEELLKVLKGVPYKNIRQRNEIICSLIGHSRICTAFFGYRNCGRCKHQLGDSLGGVDYGNQDAVIIGHKCKTCKANYAKCDWKDKLYVANPFKSS